MYIKQVKKKNSSNGKTFYQYILAQTSRINGKVKQHSILFLGSDNELIDPNFRQEVLLQLKAKILGDSPSLFPQNFSKKSTELAHLYFQKFKIKYADIENFSEVIGISKDINDADYEEVDIKNVEVLTSKSYGPESVVLQTVEKLGLPKIFESLGFAQADAKRAILSIASRAVYCASEHKTAQILDINSSFYELLDIDKKLTHRDLYPVLDLLLENKDFIDKHLYANLKHLFNIDESIIIYDLSNLYFEGRKVGSELAEFGRSKEKRNDCKQVVFTGIIDQDAFFKHSRIYKGNTVDSATLEDMLDDFEKFGVEVLNKTVVMDAAFATKENINLLNERGMKYVCVARQKIKNFTVDQNKELVTVFDKNNNPIELQIMENKNFGDKWMYVKSEQKRIKEHSMSEKLEHRFLEELQSLADGLKKKGTTKLLEKVLIRIGRIKEKHKNVSGRFEIKTTSEDGKITSIHWSKTNPKEKNDLQEGVYFIRTNYQNINEKELWDVYNTIREVEATFRCLKSDLLIRPVYHQTDLRIQGHIYQTILAYQIVNAIRYQLKKVNLNYSWKNILRILDTQRLNEIKLPAKTKNIVITKPSVPIEEVKQIYNTLNYSPNQKIKKKYVVYH